ncbi:molybdopterin-guanine dinucleotide biosynthesis protein A [Pedobacter sp. CAN_A7]
MSKRMGSDKGLLTIDQITWAEHATAKLNNLQIPVVISVNQGQLLNYKVIFGEHKLVLDRVNVNGPLNGILSVHLKYPDDDLLVLACDMMEMDVQTLQNLKDSTITFPDFDYYAYTGEGFIEPLCALYKSKALNQLNIDVQSGQCRTYSLYRIIQQGYHKFIPILDQGYFKNYNTL